MLKKFVQLFFIIVGGMTGYLYIPALLEAFNLSFGSDWLFPIIGAVIGAALFFLLMLWLADYVVEFIRKVEDLLVNAPVTDVISGTFGLILGLIVAFLVVLPLNDIGIQIVNITVGIFLPLILGYLGFRVGFKKKEEVIHLFSTARKDSSKDKKKEDDQEQEDGTAGGSLKILDTSVIIDGRIADICKTGFLEGTLIIPHFVLEELQHIADSSDALKRNRGRRGLDILNKIQKELPVNVEIYEGDFEDVQEVDSKLVKLAKLLSGVVVTNDFNLNKVCELQKVAVLNINDLANAVKPVVLPGEELKVQVIKDGKEHNQGVAYLDDGTMIVVEEGRDYIGKHIDVLVTSVLQTSAGRMIFAKPKLLEKAL
ncbi:PIN/TRAM domain-containing protein [Bacillus marinisedimentorum]|uniref:PIN/TRAM domain-containing protein n=1 Tax=Bacillus marinisedimentorum TaxID=1821260 RepID=UPI000871F74F|nr:PIN/TRAM domain-containing protein [Bacillus marinisedimentorum]